MLSKEVTKELIEIPVKGNFTPAETDLVQYIIKNERLPSYVDNRKEYNVLLRLRRKLRKAKADVMVLKELFEILDTIKVSNKLVRGGVD